jgi:hypothetical protein
MTENRQLPRYPMPEIAPSRRARAWMKARAWMLVLATGVSALAIQLVLRWISGWTLSIDSMVYDSCGAMMGLVIGLRFSRRRGRP